jgi:hypothetical protein
MKILMLHGTITIDEVNASLAVPAVVSVAQVTAK